MTYKFFYALTALVGLGLIIDVSGSHTDTAHLIELLLLSGRPVTENSTCQHTTFTREWYPCPWWNSNPQSQL